MKSARTSDFKILLGCVTSIKSIKVLDLDVILVCSWIIWVRFKSLNKLRAVSVQGFDQFRLTSPIRIISPGLPRDETVAMIFWIDSNFGERWGHICVTNYYLFIGMKSYLRKERDKLILSDSPSMSAIIPFQSYPCPPVNSSIFTQFLSYFLTHYSL